MTLKIEIKMDNAAFDQNNGVEAARILTELADRIHGMTLSVGESSGLRDFNGNKVGTAEVVA